MANQLFKSAAIAIPKSYRILAEEYENSVQSYAALLFKVPVETVELSPQYKHFNDKVEMSKRGLTIWYTLKHYFNSKKELEEKGSIESDERQLLSYIKNNALELKGTFAGLYLDFDDLENNKAAIISKMMEFLKAIPMKLDEAKLKSIVEKYVV